MKEPVLERPSPVMEIKDSEPFLYSSHSENSDRVAKKKKNTGKKEGWRNWHRFCWTFGKNRLAKIAFG
jgi:hypothetical protein